VNARLAAGVEYIRVLDRSLESTTFARDRSTYQQHLASAARLITFVVQEDRDAEVKKWIDSEERGFGWGYLSGAPGEAASAAFVSLRAALLDQLDR
jgi:hypothetical protein